MYEWNYFHYKVSSESFNGNRTLKACYLDKWTVHVDISKTMNQKRPLDALKKSGVDNIQLEIVELLGTYCAR